MKAFLIIDPLSNLSPKTNSSVFPESPYKIALIVELNLFNFYVVSEFSTLDVSIIAVYFNVGPVFGAGLQYPQFIPPFLGSRVKVGSLTIEAVQHHFFLGFFN